MSNPLTNLEKLRRYLKSIEDGDFTYITEFFASTAVVEQLPNRIYPNGIRSDTSKLAEAFEKGRNLISRQQYEIKNHFVNEDQVALEVLWTGTLAIPFGTLSAGSCMRCHSAMFFEFQDGKVIRQRNYDCFEPW